MNKTTQREAILTELRMTKSHPTADKLYELLRKKLPQISLGTVYRNLEQLTQLGTIRKLTLNGHQKRFDADLSQHYHIRCPQCDSVTDIKVDCLSNIDKNFKEVVKDIGCDNYYFELTSLCAGCREKIAKEEELAAKMAAAKKREVLSWK